MELSSEDRRVLKISAEKKASTVKGTGIVWDGSILGQLNERDILTFNIRIVDRRPLRTAHVRA